MCPRETIPEEEHRVQYSKRRRYDNNEGNDTRFNKSANANDIFWF